MTRIDTSMHYPLATNDLPSGWLIAYAQDVCDEVQSGFACGQHSADNIGVAHLRPMNVSKDGRIDLGEVKFVRADIDERRLNDRDVLFNNTNSPELIGKTALAGPEAQDLAFSNHMTRVSFNSAVIPAFGAHQLHYLWMARYYLHRCVKHVNQASISSTDFARSIPIVVPPVAEQRRIVTKVEELFSELDQGIESLKTARAQLDVYRQAVLKHAFEGKLTAQWREENKDKLETPEQFLARIKKERAARYERQLTEWKSAVEAWKDSGKSGKKPARSRKPRETSQPSLVETEPLSSLPAGWSYLRLGLVVDEPKYGTSKKCDYDYQGTGVLRIPNVVRGVVDASDLKGAHFDEDEKRTYILREGDILIIRSNGSISTVGKCALISEAEQQYLYAGYLIRVCSIPAAVLPEYLAMLLASHLLRTQIERKAKSTSGVNNINSNEIQSLIVPLCSPSEQEAVVDQLSAGLSAIAAIGAEIDNQLLKTDALRQSVLKKAFAGQLVAQNSHDEPASVLLERIKAEKETAETNSKIEKKTTRKKRTAA